MRAISVFSVVLCATGIASAERTPELAYGRRGTNEVGASAGLMLSAHTRTVTFAPSIGWFVADNLALAGIFGVSNIEYADDSATLWTALAEPSYHMPLSTTAFAFVGMGIGMAYEKDLGGNIAVAPRFGVNILVGRTGVVTPSLQYQYVSHNTRTADDLTLALTASLQISVGYSVVW